MIENNLYFERQTNATRSLIEFCLEHGNNLQPVQTLKLCLQALEDGDLDAALMHYRSIPLGGMGCFNDWLPPTVFENEVDPLAKFNKVLTEWTVSMKLLESDAP